MLDYNDMGHQNGVHWCPFVSHSGKMVSVRVPFGVPFGVPSVRMVSHPGRIVSHVVSLRVPTCPVGLSDCGTMPCLRLSWYPLYRGKISDRGRVDAYQYFIVLGNRFFYFLELKNVRGAVFCPYNCSHTYSSNTLLGLAGLFHSYDYFSFDVSYFKIPQSFRDLT